MQFTKNKIAYYHYECYTKVKDQYWEYIHKPERGDSLYYGDLKEANPDEYKKNELYIMPEFISGGDYANSGTVEISNHRVFLEQFKNTKGVHDVYGGYGTFAVAIRADVYESNKEIKEIIDKLNDYPLIDDEDLSNLEVELSDKAWDSWARDDMLDLIRKSHPSLENYEADDDFDYLFYQASDEAGEYWEAEQGGSMFIRLENITPYLRDRLIVKITKHEDLPLLVGHDWVSKEAYKEFEEKLKGIKCET